MESVLDVPPEAFDPPPRVDSAVVRMQPLAHAGGGGRSAAVGTGDGGVFAAAQAAAPHAGPLAGRARRDAGLRLQRRAEEVPVADYLALARQQRPRRLAEDTLRSRCARCPAVVAPAPQLRRPRIEHDLAHAVGARADAAPIRPAPGCPTRTSAWRTVARSPVRACASSNIARARCDSRAWSPSKPNSRRTGASARARPAPGWRRRSGGPPTTRTRRRRRGRFASEHTAPPHAGRAHRLRRQVRVRPAFCSQW
jgi:hypothetical protein